MDLARRDGWRRTSGIETCTCTCGAAHIEHVVHAGHARDVPSKRLVEHDCILPGKARRGGKWEARWILPRGGVRQAVRVALRTLNIWFVLLTLETSQASGWLKSFAPC